MIRINLLPRRPKPLTALWKYGGLLSCIVAVLIFAWAILLIHMNIRINTLKNKIEETKKQIESSQIDLQKIEALKKDKASLENKIGIINSLREKQSGPVHLLEEISLAIPEHVWLESISNSDTTLHMEGTATSYNEVSEFMNKLALSPYIKNIELESIKQSITKGRKLQRFRISSDILFVVDTKTGEKKEEKKG